MNKPSANPCRNKGFTLLEMLLAMTMTALLASSLYASLRIGFRAREQSEKSLEPFRAAANAFDIMRRDLQSTPPPRGILAGPFLGLDGGEALSESGYDSISFFTQPMGRLNAAPGIIGLEYRLEIPGGESEPALTRLVTTNLLAPETPAAETQVICRNVNEFNLRYFDGSEWFDNWDSTGQTDNLPRAVEISLELPLASKEGEPEVYRFRQTVLLPCCNPAAAETVSAPAGSSTQRTGGTGGG
ncbi:MAG TPA: GspJ family type II secretion system protein [bacterium]|nr:GspJ family type II secretion system protein [bacterium]